MVFSPLKRAFTINRNTHTHTKVLDMFTHIEHKSVRYVYINTKVLYMFIDL